MGYDTAAGTGGGELITCRRTIATTTATTTESRFAVIPYAYNMTLQRSTNVVAATAEGERLIGQGVANVLCRQTTSSENNTVGVWLSSLFSTPPDTTAGRCGSTAETDCYTISGAFTVTVQAEPTVWPSSTGQVPDAVTQHFETVLATDVLPTVVQTLATFQTASFLTNIGGSESETAAPGTNTSSTSQPNTMVLLGAIVGGAAALFVVAAMFLIRQHRSHAHAAAAAHHHPHESHRRLDSATPGAGAGAANGAAKVPQQRHHRRQGTSSSMPSRQSTVSSGPTVPVWEIVCHDDHDLISVNSQVTGTESCWGTASSSLLEEGEAEGGDGGSLLDEVMPLEPTMTMTGTESPTNTTHQVVTELLQDPVDEDVQPANDDDKDDNNNHNAPIVVTV